MQRPRLAAQNPALDPNLYVGFSHSSGILSRLIWWIGGRQGKYIDLATHAFFYYTDEHYGPVCLGAEGNGVIVQSLANFIKEHTILALYRPKGNLPLLWADDLASKLDEHYNLGGLVGMSFVEIMRRLHHSVRNPTSNRKEVFCSELTIAVIREHYDLLAGRDANTIPPQEERFALYTHPSFNNCPIPAPGTSIYF